MQWTIFKIFIIHFALKIKYNLNVSFFKYYQQQVCCAFFITSTTWMPSFCIYSFHWTDNVWIKVICYLWFKFCLFGGRNSNCILFFCRNTDNNTVPK